MTRVVDISNVVDKRIEANRANKAKGPAGKKGSQLRAQLAARNLRLPILGDDDETADRNYIKEFVLRRSRELGKEYGVEYAEQFHYIGRRDEMVKTRGYRIELGDIESALYNHPDIAEVAVIAIPDDLIGNRLMACVVLDGQKEFPPNEIRKFCSQWVPSYMVPDLIEFHDRLPKTSTGKVDKTTLVSTAIKSEERS